MESKKYLKVGTFDNFCYDFCDKMYTPNIDFENQCTGYKMLHYMVLNQIDVASYEEYIRWRDSPTEEELFNKPHIKYLTFLHENLRNVVRNNWKYIRTLEL